MASKIRVLSDHTINQIAAGEVIENPASVVKELVENSLDAGADDICVEISGGGRQLIRISDNGCGMNRDDALLCLERHATSKIRAVDDILSVGTMGFRGEAIPSIASISKFLLMTAEAPPPGTADRQAAAPAGTMLVVDGGKMVSCVPTVHAPGTTIEVKALFFNVPARKKFLKSPAVDTNEILKMLSLLALGHPTVKFQLISDGKRLLFAPRCDPQQPLVQQLQERGTAVLGQDFMQHTCPIESRSDAIAIAGVIGLPDYTRHNRLGQHLFINRRGVVSPLVSFAIRDGYGTALPSGRHPVFVLNITLPGPLVDVNVHPQKREVRLRQEQILREMVVKAVHTALRPQSSSTHAPAAHPPHVAPSFLQDSPPRAHLFNQAAQGAEDACWRFTPKPNYPAPLAAATAAAAEAPPPSPKTPGMSAPITPASVSHAPMPFAPPPPQPNSIPQSGLLPIQTTVAPPKVLATIPNYIIVDAAGAAALLPHAAPGAKPHGLLLVDQRGAHARVLFEKLQQQSQGQPIAQQALLVPYTIDLPPFEANVLRQALPDLNGMGIQIREFGPHAFLVDAIPQLFGNSDIHALIVDIVHALRDTPSAHGVKKEQERHIAQAASRAAVATGARMAPDEAQVLINRLAACQQPHLCPAGKPTVRLFSPEELAKQFQK